MLIEDLCFSYGDRILLDHYSVKLPDQGVTALAGPSGCGKTTLLRLIGGLEKPLSGILRVPAPERTAFLFQEDRLLPGLCAAAQIAVVLPARDPGGVCAWLDAVGLAGEYDTPVSRLSGGMRRRVALARCLAYGRDKELIILDEPFSGIDPDRIESLMALIRSMDVPVIYSAHDAYSLSLADRVVRPGVPMQS